MSKFNRRMRITYPGGVLELNRREAQSLLATLQLALADDDVPKRIPPDVMVKLSRPLAGNGGDPLAGSEICVTTGRTPKGCGPAGCFPGVHKYWCTSGGTITYYTHYDPV